jgi:hypothetical protein
MRCIAGGPRAAKEVLAAGREAGYSVNELKAAKKENSVRSMRSSVGTWFWVPPWMRRIEARQAIAEITNTPWL